ncbi:DUF465 domain-containing protein [Sphingomonas sp.]|uniref:DUF465 domain-containing protein n=1 Tax=Sphingomonas sp. TaxID=28214 RepID=UPI00286C40F1|nr:DUF465 domain-containing protein [Sphingomonas sp.]
MSDRLYRLMLAHQRIDDQLRREQRRRCASPFVLMRLKKMKLRAKDLMQRLSRTPQHS